MKLGAVLSLAAGFACQSYEHVFQPDANREGTHLKFTVEQPSKADMLFVVDNSRSMRDEQEALAASFSAMLDYLSPLDASYRIGIVSTDVEGQGKNCCLGEMLPARTPAGTDVALGGAGNCAPEICQCDTGTKTCTGVRLRRPHDGTLGRLIAAYDPSIFDADNPRYAGLTARQKLALDAAFPTGVTTGPARASGESGVPWVIDRDSIRQEACDACIVAECTGKTGCSVDCAKATPATTLMSEAAAAADALFNECALPVAGELISAYFRANLRGLGTDGGGLEAGIEAALFAVGVNPGGFQVRASRPESLGVGLMGPGEPNTFLSLDPRRLVQETPWLRKDALLAVMFVSDEEDCTLQDHITSPTSLGFEPISNICYLTGETRYLKSVSDLGDLFHARKSRGNVLERSSSRLTFGFIGGVEAAGRPGQERRQGRAVDCSGADPSAITSACACVDVRAPGLTPQQEQDRIAETCGYTVDNTAGALLCEAVAGDRYVGFANQFARKTFDSICRRGEQSFGAALTDFARLATLACFDLADEAGAALRPARCTSAKPELCDASLITVKRAKRQDAELGVEPTLLPRVDDQDAIDVPDTGAWYYNADDNQVCLLGIDRIIGDVYDIFILHTDDIDFSR